MHDSRKNRRKAEKQNSRIFATSGKARKQKREKQEKQRSRNQEKHPKPVFFNSIKYINNPPLYQ